jgi:hypothetical protein
MKMTELLRKTIDKETTKVTKEETVGLVNDIQLKRKELDDLYSKDKQARKLRASRSFFIEKTNGGLPVSIHKQGNEVKVFPEGDITMYFRNPDSMDTDVAGLEKFEFDLKAQVLKLSIHDFVLDCELVREKRDLFLYIMDMPYFLEDISDLPLYKRKRLIAKLSFTDNIKEVPCLLVEGSSELDNGIDLFKKLEYCNGVYVKKYNSTYNNMNFALYLFQQGDSVEAKN